MNKQQKDVLLGMILGDAFLQKTGERNARIRLEHSEKQLDYLKWKADFFPEFFQGAPKHLVRFNPHYGKTYKYVRWQSNASPQIGKWQKIFYREGKKIIPSELPLIFKSAFSLAVWFMDDGYFYERDRDAFIYLFKCGQREESLLLETFEANFGLRPKLKRKKGENAVLVFSVSETKKLHDLISPFIAPSMRYKIGERLLDPVSTEV